jgi:amidase
MAGIPEYGRLDAIGLATLIARREVTALEVLDSAIAQAERVNTAINAIILKLYDQARAVAKAPLPEGPLAGVPFLLKDLGALMDGTPTTGSSKLFADFIADHDSTIVARYRAAGLNIFGKTATSELGIAGSTESAMYGPCRNPWNLAYSAGGSSGGSAAAVAARILPVAHANDGGGSIRIPASACGLFGLKSTRGRNPSGPDVGEDWGGLAVNHCVSISVRDSAALLDASSVYPGRTIRTAHDQRFAAAVGDAFKRIGERGADEPLRVCQHVGNDTPSEGGIIERQHDIGQQNAVALPLDRSAR